METTRARIIFPKDKQFSMAAPKEKLVWTIWGICMAIYAGMNALAIFNTEIPSEKLLIGWGFVMPILMNFVWWAISFRMRSYFQKWWVFGICTAVFAGFAGFLSMLAIAQMSAIV